MPKIEVYERIAKTVLNQYALVDEKIQFLGHSENVTFFVETATEKFLLRIHQPISVSTDKQWQRPDIIESELLWLTALHRHTDIVVQEPVQNQQGKWITQIIENDTLNILYCSLLHWIDGNISETRANIATSLPTRLTNGSIAST